MTGTLPVLIGGKKKKKKVDIGFVAAELIHTA